MSEYRCASLTSIERLYQMSVLRGDTPAWRCASAQTCFALPPSGYTEFIFPIDESSELVGYEVDKGLACFVNSGLQIGQGESLHSSENDEYESKSWPVLNL